jgi:signal peptidase I
MGIMSSMAISATETRVARPRRATRLGRMLKEVVLSIAGLLGLLAMSWLLCSIFFGFSLVVFKTGSMAPAIPAGSAAIVREVAASEIAVGDVITVQREGATLPVTHRVVSISPADDPAARVVELRGDANDSNDLAPYTIAHAKRVVASFASVGAVLTVLRTPYVLGITTMLVGLLVVWAFWPRPRARRHRVTP